MKQPCLLSIVRVMLECVLVISFAGIYQVWAAEAVPQIAPTRQHDALAALPPPLVRLARRIYQRIDQAAGLAAQDAGSGVPALSRLDLATMASQSRDLPEPVRFFAETGHSIGMQFKPFYDANGGLPVFGYPLTDVLVEAETGLWVQYFERARFELCPTHPDVVQLTRIGTMVSEGRHATAFSWLTESADPQRQFFPESGHTLGGVFQAFWQAHGDIAILGYPISEEFVELLDGEPRQVQYFERGRLAYYAEYAGTPHEVQPGHLGRWLVDYHRLDPALLAPVAPLVKLASATTSFADTDGSRNALVAARQLHGQVVAPGAEFSFLRAVGELSREAGYSASGAIVNGQIVPVVAGGICQTSTTLYRAAFYAGLPIVERHNHSLYLAAFNDILSFDAAVFAPDLDLRFVNDLPGPILVSAYGGNGQVTIDLWGESDARQVAMLDPLVQSEWAAPQARWHYDPALAAQATEMRSNPRNGMQVVLGRVVTRQGVSRQDRFVSRYDAVQAEVAYGSEVMPPPDVELVGDLPPLPTPTPTNTPTTTPEQTPVLPGGPRPQVLDEPSPYVPTAMADEPLAVPPTDVPLRRVRVAIPGEPEEPVQLQPSEG